MVVANKSIVLPEQTGVLLLTPGATGDAGGLKVIVPTVGAVGQPLLTKVATMFVEAPATRPVIITWPLALAVIATGPVAVPFKL